MEEYFDGVDAWPDERFTDMVVYYSDYQKLLGAYKDLKERHQRLLDLAGGHYL